MIDLILLAAGNSKRFGEENKLLCEVDGKTMFEHALCNAINTKKQLPECINQIIVVSKYQEIKNFCKEKEKNTNCSIEYVINNHSEIGLSSSIKIGMQNQKEPQNSSMFLVCDQPYLKPNTIIDFIKEWKKSEKKLGCVVDERGITGNPCIFQKKYRDELMKLSNNEGGKIIIEKYFDNVFKYTVEDIEELKDIDKFIL